MAKGGGKMEHRYVLHAEVPLNGDLVESAETIASFKGHVDALKGALPAGSLFSQKATRKKVDEAAA